jgi:membrane protein
MIKHIKNNYRLVADLCYRFNEEGYSSLAASLAYSTLLSLVPLMLISFYVLSFFPTFKGTGVTIQDFILKNFIATSASVIANHLTQFLRQLQILTMTNLLAFAFVSILLIYNMVHAFNRVWKVRMRYYYGLSFVMYSLVLLLTPIFFGSLMLLSSYVASLPLFTNEQGSVFVREPLLLILPYFSAFVTFTFLNWVLPSTSVKLRYAALAGLATTMLFEIAKYLFSLYLSMVPTYQIIYGALATIPIFLVWLYVTWTIILFGALVCYSAATKN